MIPNRPDPNAALTEGSLLSPQSKSQDPNVALVSADAEFSRNPILGARRIQRSTAFRIVHEATIR